MANFSDLDIKSALQEMNEYAFEEFVAELWRKQGWETEVTTGAGDKGIDVIAKTDYPVEQTHLIQVKRYAPGNKVSSSEIQQYGSLRRQEDADSVIVVTTSSFTEQGTELSNSLNVKLIDGDRLCDIIREEDGIGILTSYVDIKPASPHHKEFEQSSDSGVYKRNTTDESLSESIRQDLIDTFTYQAEMTDAGQIQVEFLYNDIERMYYQYLNGYHKLNYLESEEMERTRGIIRDRKLQTVVEQEDTIQFGRGNGLSLGDVEDEVELFITLLEKVFGKSVGDLITIEVLGSGTDDGYRAL